jgi:DNA-binding winged helix-turn-helix (wHTH) protein
VSDREALVVEGKDIKMRSHSISRNVPDKAEAAFVRTERTSGSASIHFLNPSIRPEQYPNPVHNARTPSTSWNEMAELQADIDGLPILFRFLVKDVPVEMPSGVVASHADIHSQISNTLEKIVDRMRGSSLRSDGSSKPPLAIVEMISAGEPLVEPPDSPMETVLRVGPLELDLLDRTAKRGDRQIDLRPREFQLLKYMMQRSDKLLTRATLFKEVWHYKFVPETNLVDVHMGRLRRKVDLPNEASMIRSVRGAGFVLSASPLSQD